MCTGALVSPNYVLTATYCAVAVPVGDAERRDGPFNVARTQIGDGY